MKTCIVNLLETPNQAAPLRLCRGYRGPRIPWQLPGKTHGGHEAPEPASQKSITPSRLMSWQAGQQRPGGGAHWNVV